MGKPLSKEDVIIQNNVIEEKINEQVSRYSPYVTTVVIIVILIFIIMLCYYCKNKVRRWLRKEINATGSTPAPARVLAQQPAQTGYV